MGKFLTILVVVMLGSGFEAQGSFITFSARNSVTWETIEADSVYIQNITQGRDTMLIGRSYFDLNSLAQVEKNDSYIPDQFVMSNNYPNAFTSRTDFVVHLPTTDELSIYVFNILGRQVAGTSLMLPSGNHAFTLEGSALANGVYFVKAQSAQEAETIKILKTGEQQGTQCTLDYRGAGAELRLPLAKRSSKGSDVYHFTFYAQGYIPLKVEDQIPQGGENYFFDLMPVPPPDDFTSKWRGFNLLGKFTQEWSNEGYVEEDFEMIADLGFNFVRLPVDYRTYTKADDWQVFEDSELYDIDNAVEWGEQYNIHVSLNLHRAPGYCVNPPSSPLPPAQDVSLWTDETAQLVFTDHWRMFAERYKDVPREVLSFNLVNEPANISGEEYVNAVLPAIQAIRNISPNRIIISDAVDWGNARVDDILEYDVVMSPHFYQPMQISHYRAEWVDGSDSYPQPSWPPVLMPDHLYGSWKSDYGDPMVVNGAFPKGTKVSVHIMQVSTHAAFFIKTESAMVFNKVFQPGPGEGEWEEVVYSEEWDVYQNIYDRDYTAILPEDAETLTIDIGEGDWLTFSSLGFDFPDAAEQQDVTLHPGISQWAVPQAVYELTPQSTLMVARAPEGYEQYFKMNGFLQKWIDLKWQNIPVHVGEWGVYNKTPHDVTLAFMENRLKAMKAAGLGWALWNFRGSFGILDSGRKDVNYESFRGHNLDRKMLDLLQQY